jgi:hypothetical protein
MHGPLCLLVAGKVTAGCSISLCMQYVVLCVQLCHPGSCALQPVAAAETSAAPLTSPKHFTPKHFTYSIMSKFLMFMCNNAFVNVHIWQRFIACVR